MQAMEPAFLQAKKIIQRTHSNCRPIGAWNEKSAKFNRCTDQLIASILWLGEALEDIGKFVAGNMNSAMPIEAQIGHLTVGYDRKHSKSNGLEEAIQNIKHISESITTSTHCSEISGCEKRLGEQYFNF